MDASVNEKPIITEYDKDEDILDQEDNCKIHIVKFGDSLYSIAQKYFKDGSEYKKIIELNKDKYPSLKTNPTLLTVGWKLKISCEEKSESEESEKQKDTYDVNITILDKEGKPLEKVKVTLYSDPKQAYTNEQGIAQFKDVEKGEHELVINNKGKEMSQSINVKGEKDELNFKITIENQSSTNWVLIIGIVLALVIIVFFIFRILKNRAE